MRFVEVNPSVLDQLRVVAEQSGMLPGIVVLGAFAGAWLFASIGSR